MDVTIRYDADADAVLVGPPPAGPAGFGVVALTGVELTVDPSAPDQPPHAVVQDGADAMPALNALYGGSVAEAAAAAFESAVTEPVAVRPGRAWNPVRTVGLVDWLDTFSPDLLPTALLDVQFGTAVAGIWELAADELRDAGEERLTRHAGLLVTLAQELREAGGPGAPPGLDELVAAAIEELASVLPADDPSHDDVEHEEELARALRVFGATGVPLDWALLADLPGVGHRELSGAAHAGLVGSAADPEQSASVDWLQVPRGLLDTAEDTVRWSLGGPDGARTVRVRVRAAAGAPDSSRLAFRVYTPELPVPVAVGSLRRTADRTAFAGTAPLLLPARGPLSVDVHDTHRTKPPRLGADAVLARAVRWAARGVTALRLGGTAPAALATARASLEEAGELYAEAADATTRPVVHAAARRREARCTALVRATLAHGGHARMAGVLADQWRSPAEPVTAADVAVPDLGLPGWEPLVAERAFRTDPRRWTR